MTSITPKEAQSRHTLRQYNFYGASVGATLGVLVGLLISGPHFFEWSASKSFLIVGGNAIGGLLVGYLATSIALSSSNNHNGQGSRDYGPSIDADCGDAGGCDGDGGGD